ncbi:restriction endonuclease subunit S [Geobacter sulfurreducens subsp. ethanolicus]|nr:restriction endonuclease subunit S [Geobacter sulfurreducens subsp. ethanolicus]
MPRCYLSADTVSRRTLVPDDILIETAGGTRDRPTGRTLLVNERLLQSFGLPATCASFCRFLRVDSEKAEPRYVFWYLQHLYNQGVMWEHQVQHTGIARFQYTRFAETVWIPLLPRSEQRAIARIFGVLDDKIELNRRMNRTLESMAQAIFRSWFVDFEPVSSKRGGRKPVGMDDATAALFSEHFHETDMGSIPAGWRPGNTADIARYVNGKNFTKDATGTGRMVIRIAELNSGPSGSTIYNEIGADTENTAFPGDLLFSWSGSLDVYRWHRNEALVNQHIFKVVCDDYPQWFVHFHLQEAMPFFQGVAADKATTMGHIKREHLSQPDVALPPAELIAAASRIIQPLYDRMLRSERQNLSLAAQRDALLPQLLSGELRVCQAERMIGEA